MRSILQGAVQSRVFQANQTNAQFDSTFSPSPTVDGAPQYPNPVVGSSQRIGNQTQYNFNNGVSGSSTSVGNQTFYNFNNGVSGSSTTIGNQTFHSFSSPNR